MTKVDSQKFRNRHISLIQNLLIACAVLSTLAFYPKYFDVFYLPKLVALVFLSAIAFFLFIYKLFTIKLRSEFFLLLLIIGFFGASILISTFINNINFNQAAIGTFGRNNGLLTSFALAIVFFLSYFVANEIFLQKSLKVLLFIGLFNGIYSLSQLYKIDFVKLIFPWFNPYDRVFGTFGNSNFNSIFIALIISASWSFIINQKSKSRIRIMSLVTFIIHLPLVLETDMQGKLLSVFGFIITTWAFARSVSSLSLRKLIYTTQIIFIAALILIILGIFSIVPLQGSLTSSFTSLKDRYYFWLAAIDITKDNLLFGTGIDTFGYWHRQYRISESVGFIGSVGEATDNAHNAIFQISATTGVISLIFYLSLIIYILIHMIRVLRESHNDFKIVLLCVLWVIYQVHTLISVDALGISTWGWLFSGLIIGLSKNIRSKPINPGQKFQSNQDLVNSQLISKFKMILVKILGFVLTFFLIFSTSYFLINEISTSTTYWDMRKSFENSRPLTDSQLKSFEMEVLKSPQSGKRIFIAERLVELGYTSAALSISEKTSREFPREVRSWELSARILEATGNLEGALIFRRQLIILDPKNTIFADALRNLETQINSKS